VRAALDTNILVYASGLDDEQRQARALALIEAIPPENLILPVQVLGECYGVLTRKGMSRPLARRTILRWQEAFEVADTTAAVLSQATGLSAGHQLRIWDAIVLATASAAGCQLLLTEDLQDGFTWAGVNVVNPFVSTSNQLLSALLHA
jgi:predicted nucleic acid-binding protein